MHSVLSVSWQLVRMVQRCRWKGSHSINKLSAIASWYVGQSRDRSTIVIISDDDDDDDDDRRRRRGLHESPSAAHCRSLDRQVCGCCLVVVETVEDKNSQTEFIFTFRDAQPVKVMDPCSGEIRSYHDFVLSIGSFFGSSSYIFAAQPPYYFLVHDKLSAALLLPSGTVCRTLTTFKYRLNSKYSLVRSGTDLIPLLILFLLLGDLFEKA